MKKFCVMFLSAIISLSILSGCGIDYETKKSTVFILDDGSVVSTDVETGNPYAGNATPTGVYRLKYKDKEFNWKDG